ncbi:MAG: zinc dependent phospholipase C family protein [Pyrinomonadaceae bacterium]|nr:zinc dependent phospholipase C family protein [Sphingobacteriaceae bacterium]
MSWKTSIEPALLRQYPHSSAEQLLEAHAYAYGGAIMPDIGYSPFGSMIYTDFVHNVRTGDYVQALIEEAENLNEMAFALGSLAHYMADNYGHLLATNVSVPLVYPKVKKAFGNSVTYAEHSKSHSRMELSFDVLQTARGNYVSKDYHDFIGFKVAIPVVEKAFFRTYGLDVNSVFKSLPVAISTYRWTIKFLLPNIVRTAWASKKSELKLANPGLTARKFAYKMNNRAYYHEFGKDHQKAGFFPTVIGFLMPVLPKVGPLSKLRFRPPTPEVENLFIKSFDTTLVYYESALRTIGIKPLRFPNKALDTGLETTLGSYSIADCSYAELLEALEEQKFENVSLNVRNSMVQFFSSGNKPELKRRKDKKRRAEIYASYDRLLKSL